MTDDDKKKSICKICEILTEGVAGMLSESGLGVDFALVVTVVDDTAGRLTACGSSMAPADVIATMSDVIGGLRKSAAH